MKYDSKWNNFTKCESEYYKYKLEYKLYKKIIELFQDKIQFFLENTKLKHEFEKNYKKYKEYLIELFQFIDYMNFCVEIKMTEPNIQLKEFTNLNVIFEKEKGIDLFEEFKKFEKEYKDYFIKVNNSILNILNLNTAMMKDTKFIDSNFIIEIDEKNSKKKIVSILKNKIEEKISKIIDVKEKFYIINFNYTTYLQDYFKYKVININNSIYDDEIIFGIDKIQIKNLKSEDKLGNFVKSNRRKKEKEWKKLIGNHNFKKIYFYGHSLSDVDFTFFEDLFNKINIDNREIKLIFLYAKSYSCKGNVRNLMNKYAERKGKVVVDYMDKLQKEGKLELKEV